MKIGFNATCFNERPSGARQRFIGIYGALMRRMPDTEFVIYEPSDCYVASWFDYLPNVSARRTPIPSSGRSLKFIMGLGYWRAKLRLERFDLFERFNLPIVNTYGVPTLTTIHDVRQITRGEGLRQWAFRQYTKKSLRSVDSVITVSETMRREILTLIPGLPISAVYNGIDAAAFRVTDEHVLSSMRRKYGLMDDFVLAVGHFEPRKNYPRLIEAVAMLRDRGFNCPLVIIGNDSGEYRAIAEQVTRLGLSTQVRLLTGLSDLELRCAYHLCKLFVFPSAYEGFGIPILEAMSARRPMALSDLPVFKEITEDRSIFFSCDDPEAMAEAIERGLTDDNIRRELVSHGDERVLDFGFENLAEQIKGLYMTLC